MGAYRIRLAWVFAALASMLWSVAWVEAGPAYTAVTLNPYGTRGCVYGGTTGTQVGYTGNPSPPHAAIWSSTSASMIDVNPAGAEGSELTGAWGTKQSGNLIRFSYPNYTHAALWSGSATGVVDLHPSGGWIDSWTKGISGSQQVGKASNNTTTNAFLWMGTAASAVNLTGSFQRAWANDVEAGVQVGRAASAAFPDGHAVKWTGTAASVVDLHPSGLYESEAVGTDGTQHVGHGRAEIGDTHALLWTGSGSTCVDLHPGSAYSRSEALAVRNGMQVGYAQLKSNGSYVPMVWHGTAASAVELSGGSWYTYPTDIAPDGTILGYGIDTTGVTTALMWVPVPEPTTGVLVMAGLVLLGRRSLVRSLRN